MKNRSKFFKKRQNPFKNKNNNKNDDGGDRPRDEASEAMKAIKGGGNSFKIGRHDSNKFGISGRGLGFKTSASEGFGTSDTFKKKKKKKGFRFGSGGSSGANEQNWERKHQHGGNEKFRPEDRQIAKQERGEQQRDDLRSERPRHDSFRRDEKHPRREGHHQKRRDQNRGPRPGKAFGGQRSVIGVIKRHPDGYGFLIPQDTSIPDIYISKHSMAGVMTNDKLEVSVQREGDRLRGEVIRVLSHETKRVSGQIRLNSPSQGVLRDESMGWGEDLKVSIPGDMRVKDRDWVLVGITTYPDSARGFHGTVEAVIGDIEDAQNDNIRVLGTANIPFKFSKRCLEEASHIPEQVTEEDRRGRKDLREKHLITIDGKTAKDFDDAIYVERIGNGFRLWVAIADVSHYVKPGTAIDKDAFERGTSTYFPNFVAPMLPESLSNEMCSLKPNVERLALTCEMDINFEGDIQRYTVYESVIRSHARVTYGEAQEVIDGNPPERLSHVVKDIKLASELAQILMKRRYANGSLNLEIPETTIELGEDGVPTDILRGERLFAHKLIEELMLAANVAVARFLDEHHTPALYRIHEDPKRDAVAILERYLENFGYSKRLEGTKLQQKITQALQEFSGRPEETILNILALRSMAQARYSPENVGHFGLGFSHYAHFTSPIRRYPDLIIHRLVKSVVLEQKGYRKMSMDDLEAAGTMLSACEQRSVKAERQIHSIKKARFMQKHLGDELDGVISSVTRFGIFVLLRQFDVDGLVKIEELGFDRWDFDEDNLCLVARRSGQRYEIGQELRVQVAGVDIQNGRIDFVLASGDEEQDASSQEIESIQKRRPSQNNRERVREARVSRSRRKDKAHSVRRGRKNTRKNKRR